MAALDWRAPWPSTTVSLIGGASLLALTLTGGFFAIRDLADSASLPPGEEGLAAYYVSAGAAFAAPLLVDVAWLVPGCGKGLSAVFCAACLYVLAGVVWDGLCWYMWWGPYKAI
jgi:hypothetical protein